MRFRLLLLALTLAGGCYKLNLDNGQLRCSVPDKKCPSGFHCATDGYCWKNGQDPGVTDGDMGSIPDMAQNPPSAFKGGTVVSGGVTASSQHYKVIMSTGQSPGGNVDTKSQNYKVKSGLPALTQ